MPTLAVKTVPLHETLEHCGAVEEIVVLIGPEGDFSEDEVRLAQGVGAKPVSLGSLTLRSDTAAVAALAMVRFAMARCG